MSGVVNMNKENSNHKDKINALYRNVINQVLAIENQKKDLSAKILLYKGDSRWSIIEEFLKLDLQKHLLLEQAAIIVLSNRADDLVKNLERLYQYSSGEDLMSKIKKEIDNSEQFIRIVERGRKHKSWLTFTERRVMQEIAKYVLEQAREYNRL